MPKSNVNRLEKRSSSVERFIKEQLGVRLKKRPKGGAAEPTPEKKAKGGKKAATRSGATKRKKKAKEGG